MTPPKRLVLAVVPDLFFAVRVSATARHVSVPLELVPPPRAVARAAQVVASLLIVDLQAPGAVAPAHALRRRRAARNPGQPQARVCGALDSDDAARLGTRQPGGARSARREPERAAAGGHMTPGTASERFRADLRALAVEVRDRSQAALDRDQADRAVVDLRFAESVERMLATGGEQRYLPSRRHGRVHDEVMP